MDCWTLLQIQPTVDTRTIKKAYAQQLRRYHPEDDPAGFQALREAYETALGEAKFIEKSTPMPELRPADETVAALQPVAAPIAKAFKDDEAVALSPGELAEQFMRQVQALYDDFFARIDVKSWQSLLDNELLYQLSTWQMIDEQMLVFLQDHYWLPQEVWAYLNSQFSWIDRERELCAEYPSDFIQYVCRKVQSTWGLGYRFSAQEPAGVDDEYLNLRSQAFNALTANDLEQVWNCLEAARQRYAHDPDLVRLYGEFFLRVADQDNALRALQHLLMLSPDELEGYLRLGDIYLKRQDYRQAFAAYQQVLRREDNQPQALRGLACCYAARGSLTEAKLLFEQLVEAVPADIELVIQLMTVTQALLADLKRQAAATPGDERLWLQMASLHFELKQYTECRQAIEKIKSPANKNADLYLLQGQLLVGQNQSKQAVEYYNLALAAAQQAGGNGYDILIQRGIAKANMKEWQESIEDLAAAMAINPFDPEVLSNLADSCRRLGFKIQTADHAADKAVPYTQYLQAVELCDKAIALHPAPPVDYYSTRSLAYYHLRNFTMAKADFVKVVRYYYSWALAWYRKAYCHHQLAEYQEAKTCFETGLRWDKLEPDSDVRFYLALAMAHSGDYQAALETIRQYQKTGENGIKIYNFRMFENGHNKIRQIAKRYLLAADLYRLQDQWDEAGLEYEKMLKEAPGSQPLFTLAVRYFLSRRWFAKARDVLVGMAGQWPESTAILLPLIWTQMETGEWLQAEQTAIRYFQVIEKTAEPANPISYYYYGRSLYQMGKYQAAQSCLATFCSQDSSAQAASYLSLVYYELGDKQQAVVWAKQALDADGRQVDYQQRYQGILREIDKKPFLGIFNKRQDSRKAWPSTADIHHHAVEELPKFHLLTGAERYE